MNHIWTNFLIEQGAKITHTNEVDHFGDLAAELQASSTHNMIYDLSQLGIIRIEGEEAQTFLQGQFSNDLTLINEHKGQLNSYNSPKGRMYASFYLFTMQDAFYLHLPRAILETTLKRLRMFVLRAKVTLDDVSDTLIAMGISGPDITAPLSSVGLQLPQQAYDISKQSGVHCLRLPGQPARAIIYAELEPLQQSWSELAKTCEKAGASVWRLLDIQAGIPNLYPETQESFVAQMINFPSIEGVSFTKGCYPGQEVVARMHYLGNLKKRMYLTQIDDAERPLPGTHLYEASGNTQSIGTVVDAQAAPEGGYQALCVLQTKSATDANIHVGSPTGAAIKLLDLPYEITLGHAKQ